MDATTLLGTIAPIITVINILPQIHITYKTRDVNGVSILTIYMIMLANMLWFIYGYIINNIPIIITNVASFLLNLYRAILYYRFVKNNETVI